MKKLFAMLLVAAMVLAFGACAKTEPADTTPAGTDTAPAETATAPAETDTAPAETDNAPAVMSYAEYDAAELNSEVTVETYVQAKQSWWDNKATFYTQDKDGAYFL